MITRKEQIHAAIYNAAVDAGFSLSVKDGEIVATDLLWYDEHDTEYEEKPFVIRFVGNDISDVDVEIDNGVRMGA
jgi:hypothetical protein